MSADIHIRADERSWHEELFRARGNARLIVSDAIRRRYLSVSGRARFGLERMFQLVGDVRGKKILIIGCGDANTTVLMALKGAEVWATDVSLEAAKIQERMARSNGVQNQVYVVVSGAEELSFPQHFFDVVFGTAVLHHLTDHLEALSSEIRRVTKGSGFAMFAEPVVRSSFLQKIRRLFPAPHISPGERQLTDADLEKLTLGFETEFFPYNVLSRLTYFVGRKPLENASLLRKAFVRALNWSDYCLLSVRMFDRFAGGLVIRMYPKKTPPAVS
jgi:ubiquinone/menaquinone biosynthesis C-methylase UbiE